MSSSLANSRQRRVHIVGVLCLRSVRLNCKYYILTPLENIYHIHNKTLVNTRASALISAIKVLHPLFCDIRCVVFVFLCFMALFLKHTPEARPLSSTLSPIPNRYAH